MAHRIFVYGTLLRGQTNHRVLSTSRYLGASATEAGYALYDLGEYPAMCRVGTGVVVGEVYSVDDFVLAELDRLEEHPTYYQRVRLRLSDGTIALTYTMDSIKLQGRAQLHSGDWRTRR